MKFNSYLKLKTGTLLAGLFLSSNLLAAAPKNFVIKNYTPYQSKTQVKSFISPHATPAGTPTSPGIRAVPWIQLRMVCGLVTAVCEAGILVKTETPNPILVGEGKLVVATGEITPKEMIKDGFRLTSPEPGVIEIREIDPSVH